MEITTLVYIYRMFVRASRRGLNITGFWWASQVNRIFWNTVPRIDHGRGTFIPNLSGFYSLMETRRMKKNRQSKWILFLDKTLLEMILLKPGFQHPENKMKIWIQKLDFRVSSRIHTRYYLQSISRRIVNNTRVCYKAHERTKSYRVNIL